MSTPHPFGPPREDYTVTAIGAPTNFDALLDFKDVTTNPERFQEVYVPKLEQYRARLAASLPAAFKIPEEQLAALQGKMDTTTFDTVAFLRETDLLTAEEKRITATMDMTALLAAMASGELTAVAVLDAFTHRTVIVHQLLNHVMDLFYEEAHARAAELDAYYAASHKLSGPFHGIPISVKELMKVKGRTHTGCYVSQVDNIGDADAPIIAILRDLGAVLYARTNQPQTMMHLESNNNYIGRSRNPLNSMLTPGGSSSGEGVSVGARCSVVGVGSDIGGSVRAPAAFCSCFGLRPTTQRLPGAGSMSSNKGQEAILSTHGPFATSARDINYFMEHVINVGKPWTRDCVLPVVAWRAPTAKYVTGLGVRIGVLADDGMVRPHPPVRRAIDHATKALAAAGGIEIVPLQPYLLEEARDIIVRLYGHDGGNAQAELLRPSGEPLLPLTKYYLTNHGCNKMVSIPELRALVFRRDALRNAYTNFLNEQKLDFILMPVCHSAAAVGVEGGVAGPYYWGYTTLFNILDFPSITIPTGLFQDPAIDVADSKEPSSFRNEMDQIEGMKYIPELFKGAPLAFQIGGRRFHDEDVVAFAAVVEEIMKEALKKQ